MELFVFVVFIVLCFEGGVKLLLLMFVDYPRTSTEKAEWKIIELAIAVGFAIWAATLLWGGA